MKNKKWFAFIAGIICLVILVVALIWSLNRGNEKPDPDENTAGQGDAQQPQNPEGGNTDVQQPSDPDSGNTPNGSEEPAPSGNEGSSGGSDSEGSGSGGSDSEGSGNGALNPNPTSRAEIEAVLNDPFMILVNRERKVSSDYVGADLVTYSGDYKLNSTCASALRQLIAAGKKAGYSYTLYSGYRSYSSQYNKYYNKIASYKNQGYSESEAIRLTDQYYAPPGGSEHHTGLAADVCIPSIVNKYGCLHEDYEQTEEFRWFSSHAHEYGFILRYPKGDEDITGYNYEPWHYRYVGVEIATEIHRQGITLEEYVETLESRLASLKS